ncbi:hypothetical protein [Nesterenkonia rhizosphaerae]|uniref:Uncharacterized protein n=1 Tax=Nesterenkonia rhizosphaerae TaxID=1348272 RepID=A0ABP9G2M0_9MICC
MNWQEFKKQLAKDAKKRAVNGVAALVLLEVGGLLTEAGTKLSRLEITSVKEGPQQAVTVHHEGPVSAKKVAAAVAERAERKGV